MYQSISRFMNSVGSTWKWSKTFTLYKYTTKKEEGGFSSDILHLPRLPRLRKYKLVTQSYSLLSLQY